MYNHNKAKLPQPMEKSFKTLVTQVKIKHPTLEAHQAKAQRIMIDQIKHLNQPQRDQSPVIPI